MHAFLHRIEKSGERQGQIECHTIDDSVVAIGFVPMRSVFCVASDFTYDLVPSLERTPI